MTFLRAGILVPIGYFGTLLIAPLFYPGYSHARQYASELGSSGATYPQIFNVATVVGGVCCFLALFGFHQALRTIGAKPALTWLFLISLGGFAFGLVMAGVFPMPDHRHGAFGAGVGVHLAPFLLAAAIWRVRDLRALRAFLLMSGIAALAMFVVMMGVGGIVRRANVGAFQRAYALASIPWIGIASWQLLRFCSRNQEHRRVSADYS